MEVGASYQLEIDQLSEAFGSAFSIEYIASTYLQANRNVDMAGEILCELQANAANDVDKSPRVSTESCNLSGSGELYPSVAKGDSKALGMGEGPVYKGCVAGITGKYYARPGSLTSVRRESMMSEFSTKTSSSSSGGVTLCKDIDEFVFKMLGDGFQLDMPVIHEVLSACGYDIEKSMETLLEKSASTLGKKDDILSKAPEVSSQSYEEMVDLSCQEKSQHSNPVPVRSSKKRNKVKNDLEKELMQSLFTVSKRLEDEPKKCLPRLQISRSGRCGKSVAKPLEDTPIEHKILYVTPLQTSKDEDEDSFHALCQAVNEHWATMKEYYKAAGEAFIKGDNERANRLMEQGHFFSKKARETDDMSLQKIMETREEEEELVLDIAFYEPKESVQLLRSQLVILCGIPCVPYLKIKLGNGEGGAEERSRKRRVLKLLEKESIKWTETEDDQIISVRVDEINPKSLSFSKK